MFIICSVCLCVCVRVQCVIEFLGKGERVVLAMLVHSGFRKLLFFPLELPLFFHQRCSTFPLLVLACSSHVGCLRANFEQNQIKSLQRNRSSACAFKGFFFLSSVAPSLCHLPAECEEGFVSNSLVHLHYHHPASQAFSRPFPSLPSVLLFSWLLVHSFCCLASALLIVFCLWVC